MNLDKNYGHVIWTNHALKRLGQRGLTQEMAWQSYKYPDMVIDGKTNGSKEFQKNYGDSKVTIIGKKNDRGEWIILSCWIDPPLAGSIDIKKKENYKRFQKASFWGKIFLTLKEQLGL